MRNAQALFLSGDLSPPFRQIEYAVNQIANHQVNYHAARNRYHRLHCARGDIIYHASQVGNRDVADDACPLNQVYDRRLINGLSYPDELRQRYQLERLEFGKA